MNIVLVTNDLMFASRIEARATVLGGVVRILASGEAAVAFLQTEPVQLVLIDLDHPVAIPPLVTVVRQLDPPPRIAAYGAHVRPQRITDAASAGCDEVFTRGQFDAQLPQLIERWLSPLPSPPGTDEPGVSGGR